MPFLTGVLELVVRTVVAFTLPQIIGYKGICLAGPLALTYFIVMKEKQYQIQ